MVNGLGGHASNAERKKKALDYSKAFFSVPGTGVEPARPKAQPSEDCASTNFATRVDEVPRAGLEPARPNGHMALNHACLPISAPGQCIKKGALDTLFFCNPSGTRTQDPLIKSEML